MAINHSWNGQEIDELPAEILGFSIKEIPRSTLKEISIRLNKDSIVGNWESLAEKLGFTQSSVLDTLIERARVQNTYPGLLTLQDWAERPGSTAFVLLHALREIQREDVLSILVQKLFELNSLQLSVSVEDRSGVLQFLRVGTRKSAPLHASLDNILQHPLYWYDIVGPRRDVDWNTASGELQGIQLTLKLRGEPNQHSLEQIYGTASRPCQAPKQQQPDYSMGMQIEGGQGEGHKLVNQLQMNIPPTQASISVTMGAAQLNVSTQGPVRLKNNLSANDQFNIPPTIQHRLNITRSVADTCDLPAPTRCGPRSASPRSMGYPQPEMLAGPATMLDALQPMTQFAQNYGNLPANVPFLSDFNGTFSEMSDLSGNDQFTTSLPQSQRGAVGPSQTFPMQVCPTSFTDIKQPVTGFQGGRLPREDDESLGRQNGLSRPHTLGRQNAVVQQQPEGFACLESPDKDTAVSSCTSLLHQDYVTHNSLIEFCNNPTSPISCGSGSSPSTPNGHPPPIVTSTAQPAQVLSHFLGTEIFRGGEENTPPGCNNWQQSGYVPHSFIQQMSQNLHRSASAPNLDEDLCMEEGEQFAADSNNMHVDERMDITDAQSGNPGRPPCASLPAGGAREDAKPAPCGYSFYRPDLMHHHYQNFKPGHVLTHSISMDAAGDGGYIDMTGTHSTPTSHQQQQDSGHSSSVNDPRLRPSSSFDGYMNDSVSRLAHAEADSAQSLDSGAGRPSEEGMDNIPRNRRPFPPSGSDMFQPRNRNPVTQDHDMLLSDESEYCYIDPAPLRGDNSCDSRGSSSSTPQAERRSSGGSLAGGKPESGHRKKFCHRSRELADSELQQVPGWNANVNDKTSPS
ncbi:uncharacterized protein [Littorina saxatilis]|uniref:uncharacterized protein isoform X2 n=1 Tax=Littorina saxatilis TaxID=31220 RepID=UPI0038B56A3C